MPTVKTREFKYTGKSGESFAFKEAVMVDSKGEFSVNLPEELIDAAKALGTQPVWKGHVIVHQARVHWRASGRVLDQVERFIEDVLQEHLAVDVKEELVIRYRYENNTAGARAEDGSLHPNGHWAKKEGECNDERSWDWAGNRSVNSINRPHLFGVGIVARVYLKRTYTRPSGSKVTYSNDLPGSHWDKNPMRRLNDFIVNAPSTRGDSGIQSSGDWLHEMPYTDAAAMFFGDLMLAMLRLGEQLDAFVGDKDTLLLAIERGANLLGAPVATVKPEGLETTPEGATAAPSAAEPEADGQSFDPSTDCEKNHHECEAPSIFGCCTPARDEATTAALRAAEASLTEIQVRSVLQPGAQASQGGL